MPIQRRLPKHGFKNINRIEYKVFNLGQIDQLIEKHSLAEFSIESLYVNNLIGKTDRVKILGNGELKTLIPFKVNAITKKAKSTIEAAGGAIEIVNNLAIFAVITKDVLIIQIIKIGLIL